MEGGAGPLFRAREVLNGLLRFTPASHLLYNPARSSIELRSRCFGRTSRTTTADCLIQRGGGIGPTKPRQPGERQGAKSAACPLHKEVRGR